MGIFDFFKAKSKEPDYDGVIVKMQRIALMDVNFKKLKSIRFQGFEGKLSEITVFDKFISQIFIKGKHDIPASRRWFITEDEIQEFHYIKTEEQELYLNNLVKELLISLVMNNYKYCYIKGDLENLLFFVNNMESLGRSNHSLWKSHYQNLK